MPYMHAVIAMVAMQYGVKTWQKNQYPFSLYIYGYSCLYLLFWLRKLVKNWFRYILSRIVYLIIVQDDLNCSIEHFQLHIISPPLKKM